MPITLKPPPYRALSAAEEEAFQFVVQIYRDFQNKRPENIRAVQEPDTTVWDAFTPYLITEKERVAFHTEDVGRSKTRGEQSLVFTPLHVRVFGKETAMVVCMCAFSFAPPRPLSGELRITSVMERRKGNWKMLHHHEAVPPTGWPDE